MTHRSCFTYKSGYFLATIKSNIKNSILKNMNHGLFSYLLCATLFCLNVGLVAQVSTKAQPNIIFILTDDMGYGDMGVAGNPYILTPNIDRLAHEGTRYTNFFVNSAVCAPSRVAFMTGHFPARLNAHHIYFNEEFNKRHQVPPYLDPNTFTLADALKNVGYTTAHIGKWHLAGLVKDVPDPSNYGFDEWLITHGNIASSIYRQRWKTTEHPVSMTSQWIMEDAVAFIKKHKDNNKPFYLNLWTLAPHSPLKPTPEELALYSELKASPDSFESWMHEYANDAKNFNEQMKIYAATMTGLDTAIGKLLTYLDETGLAENTIIIFSSDNGPEDYHEGGSGNAGVGSPDIYRGRKRSPYLGGMKVPMIVRWPAGTPAGAENASVWSAIDFLPTIASIAGSSEVDKHYIDGENMASVFHGAEQIRNRPLFWEWKNEIFGNEKAYRSPQVCMLAGDWWAGWNPDGERIELYNISKDPAQVNNVKEDYPEITAKMVNQLKAWKATLLSAAF